MFHKLGPWDTIPCLWLGHWYTEANQTGRIQYNPQKWYLKKTKNDKKAWLSQTIFNPQLFHLLVGKWWHSEQKRIRSFFYENALYKFTFDIDIKADIELQLTNDITG